MNRDELTRFLDEKHEELGSFVLESQDSYQLIKSKLGMSDIDYISKEDEFGVKKLTYTSIKETLVKMNQIAVEMCQEVSDYGKEKGISKEVEFLEQFEPNMRGAYNTAIDILKNDKTGNLARYHPLGVPERLRKEDEARENPYSKAEYLWKTTKRWLDRPSCIALLQDLY